MPQLVDLFLKNGIIVKDIIDIGNGAKRPAEVGRKFFLTLKSKLREILFDVGYRSVLNLFNYHQYQAFY